MRITDPNDVRLLTVTPEEQRRALREWHLAKAAHAIVSNKEELPRASLAFERHWIEHEPTGNFYRHFDGDPHYAPTIRFYYVSSDGDPIMLEPCTTPASRADLERSRARRNERRLEREAEIAQRRAQRLAEAKAAKR